MSVEKVKQLIDARIISEEDVIGYIKNYVIKNTTNKAIVPSGLIKEHI